MIQPTIIKTDEERGSEPKPTVIRTEDHASSQLDKTDAKPSVISVSENEKAVVSPTVIAATTKPDTSSTWNDGKAPAPTRMAGKERNRIPVTLEDLKKDHPETSDSLLEKALQYVLETDLDLLKKSSALLWQTDLQKRYGDKVMQLLEGTQHGSIAKANSHISRIIEILDAIDLRGVCEYEKDGMLSKFFKSSNKEFDTPEELHHAEKELKQLTSLLGGQLKALLHLQCTLQSLNLEIQAIGKEIQAAALAAQFLSNYLLRHGTQKLSDQFMERSMSLTQTEVQIAENEPAREVQMEHPIRLISTIQHAVLVMIPDWLGSVSSIRSMLDLNKKVTITEVEELSDWKKKILKQLN